jgi:hypothetical protein
MRSQSAYAGFTLAGYHASGAEYSQRMALAAIAGLLTRTGSVATATQLLGTLERLRDDARIIGAAIDPRRTGRAARTGPTARRTRTICGAVDRGPHPHT